MEGEFLKRNTDCVYFLASPLTCKKGIECEYRHSEIARLNPRDCWYWLEGSCLNPICAFRHPPLGGDCEPSPQPAFYQSEPVNKTNVPCYFFFNGFCNKGDTCSFLHGLDHSSLAEVKPVKTVCAVKNVPLVKKTTQVESIAFSTKTETQPCPVRTDPQKESKSLDSLLFSDQSSDSLEDGYISSNDLVDGHTEHVDRWESSPGFGDIVKDKLDHTCFEDDSEFAQTFEIEQSELNSDLMRYGYEHQYDSTYPEDARIYDHELCDSHSPLEKQLSPKFAEIFPDSVTSFSRKRKFLHRELPVNKWRSTDLRDCLRRRMFIDDHSVTRFSRRYTPPHSNAQIWERHRRHHKQSKVLDSITESRSEMKDRLSRANRQSLFRPPSQLNRSMKNVKGRKLAKKQFLAPGTLKETVPRSFSGPKTLSQIKEEKKSGRENGDHFGKKRHPSKNYSKNFMGPMTLSEILKNKLGSTVNGGTISSC